MKKFLVLFFVCSLWLCSQVSFTQTKIDPSEISSSVPQLSDFHEVIYPMWHEAYPAKDYKALIAFVPQIKSNVEAIKAAKLPGILRDKETEWKKAVDALNSTADGYYKAADSNNNAALLQAAEKLHSDYERLNRVIRPAIKEIDDFHQTLYIIYHKLYPDGKYDEIAGLTSDLVKKAQAIMNYPPDKLKQRLGNNVVKFDASSKKLYNAAIALKEVLNGNDQKKKSEAVLSLHEAYQNLDAIFD